MLARHVYIIRDIYKNSNFLSNFDKQTWTPTYTSNHPFSFISTSSYMKGLDAYEAHNITKHKLHNAITMWYCNLTRAETNFLCHFCCYNFAFLFSATKKPNKDRIEKALKQIEAISRDRWRPVIDSTSNKLVVLCASVV